MKPINIILKYSLSIVLALCISNHAISKGYFEETPKIKQAYIYASSLRMDLARSTIAEIKSEEPDNLMVLYVENYIDFFTIFINENEDEFNRLEEGKDQRLSLVAAGDKNSPYYLFILAEINLQWAAARSKFDQKFTAARELYRAYKLLEENKKLYPDFILNNKSLSIMHAVGESIPSLIRKIVGVKGSVKLGTEEIEQLIDYADQKEDFIYRAECYAIYAYILFYQNNKKSEAYELLFQSDLSHTQNPLLCFLKATIAQKYGDNRQAIQILEERPIGEEYMPFHYLDFMYGKFKLCELDTIADQYMLSFIDQFKGRHYIKEAYQKLAWFELVIHDNIAGYKKYMKLCQSEGFALVDEDKQALRESKEKEIPNATLLKARLLFDGGQYAKAYALLAKKSHLFHNSKDHEVEFSYRMGRISEALLNFPDAISYYVSAIDKDSDDTYMSCNAAYRLGLMFESQNDKKAALMYLEQCLNMDPKQYKSSIHQKAKTAMDRLEN